jgi:prepilin-type N-terminal cleavage/methylation domain-containing protein
MLSNIRKRKAEGFTLIEVMIVLAIAGLILLVVFLAVPALQRNARNTTRREDAGNILAAVSEYVSNNNGALPTAVGGAGSAMTIGTGTAVNTVPVTLGYYTYTATNITVTGQSTYGTTNNTTVDTIAIVTGATCNSTGTDPAPGSSRAVVILYKVEPDAKQCRQS